MDARLALGINISIILTLTIFTGLLVPPLKLLLNTNYNQMDDNVPQKNNQQVEIEFKNLQICPGNYEYLVKTIFSSSYDRNCSYASKNQENYDAEKVIEDSGKESTLNLSGTTGGFKIIRPKSVPVTDHILALMLVVSVIGALVEILRIRFGQQDQNVEGLASRRSSLVDLMLPRTREPVKAQMSLDVNALHRSPLRVIGTRTPPLIRRSSFPTYFSLAIGDDVGHDSPTPPRSPRRPSVLDSSESCSSATFHRRARLIRRH